MGQHIVKVNDRKMYTLVGITIKNTILYLTISNKITFWNITFTTFEMYNLLLLFHVLRYAFMCDNVLAYIIFSVLICVWCMFYHFNVWIHSNVHTILV